MQKDIEKYGDEREAEGRDEQARETALALVGYGMSTECIAEAVGRSVDKVNEWLVK